jgi:PEP-CTERM motif
MKVDSVFHTFPSARTFPSTNGLIASLAVAASLLSHSRLACGQVSKVAGPNIQTIGTYHDAAGNAIAANLTHPIPVGDATRTFDSRMQPTGGTLTGGTEFTAIGDDTYSLSAAPGSGMLQTDAWITYHNGLDAPVEISNFQLSSNAQWINSGGGASTPITSPTIYAAILPGDYAAAPTLSDPVDLFASIVPLSLTGDGSELSQTFVGTSPTSPSTCIIPPNQDYTVWISVRTSFDNSAYSPSEPSVSIENQFSNNGFGGYTASLSMAQVPEPSSIAPLTIGAIGFGLAWRKRQA